MLRIQPILGIGAGGHSRVLIDAIRAVGDFVPEAMVDADSTSHGTRVAGVEIFGGDEKLPELIAAGIRHAFIGLGGACVRPLRATLFQRAQNLGLRFPAICHPSAMISPSAELGEGSVVMARACVGPGVSLAENTIINTGAIVEHDGEISAHAHISIGAILAGGVRVAEGAFVGAGAVVRQGIHIGAGALVGAGAVVVSDVPDGITVLGVPAKPMV